ncbi:MAG: DUF1670 domain-containing protein [Chloroflexi bacterium]|nr:DUF1670 domain-containing protein [Chloroflexota bacterium]
MSAPTTREKQARRLGEKGLYQQLCQAFEHDYGFDKGRRVIPVIVEDILDKVRDYYGPDRAQEPNQIVYTAAQASARLTRGKTMAQTAQQAIRLTMVAPEDCVAYGQGAAVLLRQRLERWLHEAVAQGALLTAADLAFLCGLSIGRVERLICEYERDTGKLLPLRGTVHDASSKLTHKPQIVARYLAGQLPPEIARATNHSIEAVEHYLRDFALVRELVTRYDAEAISRLIGRGVRVVREYLALLQTLPQEPTRDPGTTQAMPPPDSHQTC